jgi:metallo-beta-lactamase family protein
MKIEFIGAAQTVTGSKHLLRTKQATILLDCGFFQGRRRESIAKNRSLGFDPRALDAVVLSHAHIDHSGALPLLVKEGYDGPIYVTPATRDLCAVMLEDAAMIQAQDARYVNKAIARDHAAMEPVEPLFTVDDAVAVIERMVAIPYHRRLPIGPGVHLTFHDAGHVLGSAIVVLDAEAEKGRAERRLVYTGDLGRHDRTILRDPEIVLGADALVTESTYGDRIHKPITAVEDELASVLARTHARGGKVVIPSFALERAQEILYAINLLRQRGQMPKMPVYVDSPLTVKITDVFRLHPDCFDAETRALIRGKESPFDFPELRYVEDKEESKSIDASPEPCVIISASGMCEAGRIVHHLKATIEDEKNTIAIVGFQAAHTLGRRIVERRRRVKIFGVERDLRAEVATLNGFSAHADQNDLVAFAEALRERGSLGRIALVHGEPPAQAALIDKLRERGMKDVHAPAPGDVVTF